MSATSRDLMGKVRRPKRSKWLGYTEAASVGLEMAVAVAIGGLGGLYLESHVTHWSPWTSLLGLGLGIGAAANTLVRVARDLKAAGAASENPDPSPTPGFEHGKTKRPDSPPAVAARADDADDE